MGQTWRTRDTKRRAGLRCCASSVSRRFLQTGLATEALRGVLCTADVLMHCVPEISFS